MRAMCVQCACNVRAMCMRCACDVRAMCVRGACGTKIEMCNVRACGPKRDANILAYIVLFKGQLISECPFDA